MKIVISAGETSGDEHGAELTKALLQLNPQIEITGMGGRSMRKAGVKTFIDSESSASVMGFKDVFLSLNKILKTFNFFKQELLRNTPDLLILIDYPDFNLRLAKFAKNLGIKTVYFIPPKIWAWRSGRITRIKKFIDQVLCIFPFEPEFYKKHGYDNVSFVGHPFSTNPDLHKISPDERVTFLNDLGLDPNKPVLTLFPGSRKREILDHLSVLIDAIKKLDYEKFQTIITVAPNIPKKIIAELVPNDFNCCIYQGKSTKSLQVADIGIIKSGTSNLQAAFLELPFAMFYKMGAISEFLARNLVPLKEYSIVNIIRPNSIKELVDKTSDTQTVSNEIYKLLNDNDYRNSVKNNLQHVKSLLESDKNSSTAYLEAAKICQAL